MSLELSVDLGDRSYPILIGESLQPGSLTPFIYGKQAVIVTNDVVGPLYLQQCKAAVGDKDILVVEVPDGEKHKSFETLNKIFSELLENRQDRKTTLIALGGGVIGDMTGFAAACYQRGVPFIQVPTTLLAQVDSSVGGKTAVNHPLGKNMIGAFYQPEAVLIDVRTLSTLPDREWSAGMAEVIKYGLIYDNEFYRWLNDNKEALKQKLPSAVSYAIHRSCEIKAEVVSQDEKEAGIRAILNLGHTFGHAIEAEMGYGNWLHGEAVAAGMVMAMDLSIREGWIDPVEKQTLVQLLQYFDLPSNAPKSMDAAQFMAHMNLDKKVENGIMRLVLLKNMGEAVVTDRFSNENLTETFKHAS